MRNLLISSSIAVLVLTSCKSADNNGSNEARAESRGARASCKTEKLSTPKLQREYKDRLFEGNQFWKFEDLQPFHANCHLTFEVIDGQKMVRSAPQAVLKEDDGNGGGWAQNVNQSFDPVTDEKVKAGEALLLNWDDFILDPDTNAFDPISISYTYNGRDKRNKPVEMTLQFRNPQRPDLCKSGQLEVTELTDAERLHLAAFNATFVDGARKRTNNCFDLPFRNKVAP